MAVAAASQAARLGRNLSSEKLVGQPEQQQQQRQRNPTILRKSKCFSASSLQQKMLAY
jgi:hypothetical protein